MTKAMTRRSNIFHCQYLVGPTMVVINQTDMCIVTKPCRNENELFVDPGLLVFHAAVSKPGTFHLYLSKSMSNCLTSRLSKVKVQQEEGASKC